MLICKAKHSSAGTVNGHGKSLHRTVKSLVVLVLLGLISTSSAFACPQQTAAPPTLQELPQPRFLPTGSSQPPQDGGQSRRASLPAPQTSDASSPVIPASYVSETPQPQTPRPIAPPSEDLESSAKKPNSPFGMFLSLVFVIGLILAGGWLAQKSGWAKTLQTGLPEDVVHVVGRQSIGGRQQLLLVKFGSKVLLVSNHQGDARTLSEITDPAEVRHLLSQSGNTEPHERPVLRNLFGGKSS